jgi:hypothetical protein
VIANALLVRHVAGWVEVLDAASIAATGRREAYLDVGAQQSATEAVRLAQAQLADSAHERVATTVEPAPLDGTDTPFLAYAVGDHIDVPTWDGSMRPTRVLALGGAVDDDGFLSFSVDLADQVAT